MRTLDIPAARHTQHGGEVLRGAELVGVGHYIGAESHHWGGDHSLLTPVLRIIASLKSTRTNFADIRFRARRRERADRRILCLVDSGLAPWPHTTTHACSRWSPLHLGVAASSGDTRDAAQVNRKLRQATVCSFPFRCPSPVSALSFPSPLSPPMRPPQERKPPRVCAESSSPQCPSLAKVMTRAARTHASPHLVASSALCPPQ